MRCLTRHRGYKTLCRFFPCWSDGMTSTGLAQVPSTHRLNRDGCTPFLQQLKNTPKSRGDKTEGCVQTHHVNMNLLAAAAAKSLQSCPTPCDPIDGSPPGSPVPGILQARPLEWVAISFSNAWKWKVKVKSLSRVRLLATPWTATHQAPLSMGFSRQEYWSGVPLPSPMNLLK